MPSYRQGFHGGSVDTGGGRSGHIIDCITVSFRWRRISLITWLSAIASSVIKSAVVVVPAVGAAGDTSNAHRRERPAHGKFTVVVVPAVGAAGDTSNAHGGERATDNPSGVFLVFTDALSSF
jgi:hypothetical protein